MLPAFHLIVALLGCVLVAVTLPLLLELLVLSLAAMLPVAAVGRRQGNPLRLAVVVPAHNEQKLIGSCVRSVGPGAEVFVVAHNCDDATAVRAAEAGATVLELNDPVGGKGTALDYGFRQAVDSGAEVLLVLDADSIAGRDLVAAVSTAFAAGAQAVQCRYEVANPDANRRTRLAALAFQGMNVLRPLGRHRLGLSCGIFGNGFALSATTLARVPYTPNSLVEDLEYHLHLIRAGIRVEFLNHASVFGEMPETTSAATSQRARWEGGRILMRRLWSKPLALEVLHGQLKMLEPLLDLLAVPLATEAALLMLTLVCGVVAHVSMIAAYGTVGLATLVLYVLVAASLGPDPIGTMQALAAAPAFLAWKILMIPRTRLAARADAAWVRTERNTELEKPNKPTA
jgi:cellulose synthase/poly-beta-1,6-N-acetylglucosamine synthase-like glycosyltransferase